MESVDEPFIYLEPRFVEDLLWRMLNKKGDKFPELKKIQVELIKYYNSDFGTLKKLFKVVGVRVDMFGEDDHPWDSHA